MIISEQTFREFNHKDLLEKCPDKESLLVIQYENGTLGTLTNMGLFSQAVIYHQHGHLLENSNLTYTDLIQFTPTKACSEVRYFPVVVKADYGRKSPENIALFKLELSNNEIDIYSVSE